MLFCHISSHVDGDAYQTLLRDKGGCGFPYLVFMDSRGDVLANQRKRHVGAFEKTQRACKDYLVLAKKAAAGDTSVAADLLMARIEMGSLTLTDAREAEAKLTHVAVEKRAKLFGLMLKLEVTDALSRVRNRKQRIEVGKQFQNMWGQRRVPKGDAAPSFYSLIMEAAYDQGDAGRYERAFKAYKRVAPKSRNRAIMLDRLRSRLNELKARRQAEKPLTTTRGGFTPPGGTREPHRRH